MVDNTDSAHVQIRGNWETKKGRSYGPDYFITEASDTGSARSVRFIPEIKKSGIYQIYAYFPKLKNTASKTYTSISNGTKTTEKAIGLSDMQVQGQASGEWVSLGTYNLLSGKRSFVEISDKNADGVIIADAVLFVPARQAESTL